MTRQHPSQAQAPYARFRPLTAAPAADLLLERNEWHIQMSDPPLFTWNRSDLERLLAPSSSRVVHKGVAESLKQLCGLPLTTAMDIATYHPVLLADEGKHILRLQLFLEDCKLVSTATSDAFTRCVTDPQHLIGLFLPQWEDRLNQHRKLIHGYFPPFLQGHLEYHPFSMEPAVAWGRLLIPPSVLRSRLIYLSEIPKGAWKLALQQTLEQQEGKRKSSLHGRHRLCEMSSAFVDHPHKKGLPLQEIELLEAVRDDVDPHEDDER